LEGLLDILNELLEYKDCNVDYINIKGMMPLHLAVNIKELELRTLIVDSLLNAGTGTRLHPSPYIWKGLPL
jgi:hypothetical protein